MSRRIGGSLEEGRTLLAEESGYSSPNMSSQPTPTANRKLITPAFRRSFELCPYRHPSHARMSLPCEPLKGNVDGRYSAQASEKRSRLIRERRVSQEDEPCFKFEPGRRRLSKHGSWSKKGSTGEESGFEEEEPVEIRVPPCVIEERRDSGSSGPIQPDNSDHLSEWTIPWDKLRFGNVLRGSKFCRATTKIYRGRWHGDVMIHTFDGDDSAARQQFDRLVTVLALIRHENVELFMGACVKPPQLAVVTGPRRGVSLYHHSLTRPPSPYSSRIAVAKQVSQAMSYLHSRDIVHGHLNSRNVFLEAKIKLSVFDHSMVEEDVTPGPARIPRHLLNYLPPEISEA
ncbi:kinase suppressor of Ras 1-like [Hyalella azteca]|uniref:Kinase suppressor of Ras 1-like n=1 Tax=Hyalella azteca TaxID=294128 RepID=A0A979FUA3_HYAAZ|nr:kinase suppressor of Ras 1-like [Hyalella azteca]